MNDAVVQSTLGLASAVALLLVVLVLVRAAAGSRRRRRRELRPGLELALAAFLAHEGAPVPAAQGGLARRVLRNVGLDALAELRGRERARVTTLFEQLGYVDEAIAALDRRSRRERRRAADALALIRSPGAVAALTLALGDRDPAVRAACARALAETGDDAVVARIIRTVEADATRSPGAAADVLLALGTTRPSALGDLLSTSHSAELRALAAAVIGELRIADHAPLLRAELGGADDELVARAARGLGLIGDADALEALLELVSDSGRAWFVRVAAATALGSLGDPSAARALEWQLRTNDWWLQHSAAQALARLGHAGEDALRRALESRREQTRAHARVALSP